MQVPHQAITHLYFVESGMGSMTGTFEDGSQVEVGTFGFESVIGISALMGTKKALNRVYTQIPGHGYSCPIDAARKEFNLAGRFHWLALRYVQAQLDQATQSIACNAKHKFQQRLARWLLICADRADNETFKISHSLLADMLGGTRATVTLAAGALKKKNLIRYQRGVITILDHGKLQKNACECYLIVKDHVKNFYEFEAPFTE